jgi:hypothetical protein
MQKEDLEEAINRKWNIVLIPKSLSRSIYDKFYQADFTF